MSNDAASFIGSIPQHYDQGLGPIIFVDYAADIARRVASSNPTRVLETAAGTGIVTRKLRDALSKDARLTATDLNPPMLEVVRTADQTSGHGPTAPPETPARSRRIFAAPVRTSDAWRRESSRSSNPKSGVCTFPLDLLGPGGLHGPANARHGSGALNCTASAINDGHLLMAPGSPGIRVDSNNLQA